MGLRTGLLVGFAVGYVLGARAGQERYRQVVAGWRRIAGSPTAKRVAEHGRDLAGEVGRRGVEAIQRGVSRVGASIRDRLGEPSGDGSRRPSTAR